MNKKRVTLKATLQGVQHKRFAWSFVGFSFFIIIIIIMFVAIYGPVHDVETIVHHR